MPLYLFQGEDGQVREILQSMNDKHVYRGEKGEKKQKWRRIFTVPQASISLDIDPHDNNAFVRRTADMKGSVGDLHDLSAELSAKRAAKNGGVDPVKMEAFDRYKKENNGQAHYLDTRGKTLVAEKKGFKIRAETPKERYEKRKKWEKEGNGKIKQNISSKKKK